MGAIYRAAAVALLVAGCSTGSPVAPPEIKAMLDFAAYPGATRISEQISDAGPMPLPMTTYFGSRTYETADPPDQVRSHYESLAKTHGWSVEGPSPMPSARPDDPVYFMLRRQRFTIAFDVRRGDFSYEYPAPSPDPSAKTRITVSASTSN